MNSIDDDSGKKIPPYNLLFKLTELYKILCIEDLTPHKNSILVYSFSNNSLIRFYFLIL